MSGEQICVNEKGVSFHFGKRLLLLYIPKHYGLSNLLVNNISEKHAVPISKEPGVCPICELVILLS